ncbi:MAG: DUF2789 domain-containing protein [Moritella sp.]|uniref:DUF2789 domain-containing protein n=2 Tax=unclassified Moritella TaxID=2637987 RepID=UPI000156860F|nr:hypothetical protein PE36_06737 [Moritella sp. PE36]PHR87099.1 MAG: DUF2789 domain-containing protein [Moritella sp.]
MMLLATQTLELLFAQLGLDNDELSMKRFISQHKLDAGVLLFEAPFWNNSQAMFLKESIYEDADWAEVIDHLDAMLR